MGLPSRSSAADVHDCIMVRIRTESTEYKGVARSTAPVATSPRIISWIPTKVSDTGQFRELAPCAQASRRFETQAALRRQAAPLTPFRARREPDRRRPTKNGLCTPNKELEAKPRRTTSRIDLPKPPRNVTVTIDNRSSAFPDIASPHPLSAAERQARRRARRSPVERTPSLGAGAAPPATASA
jgi:hypothetical protein